MPDAEDAVLQLPQAGAEREIEALERRLADAIRVGGEHRRQRGGMLALVEAEHFQAPGANGPPGGLGVAGGPPRQGPKAPLFPHRECPPPPAEGVWALRLRGRSAPR